MLLRYALATLILAVGLLFAHHPAQAQSVPSGFFVENAAGTATFASPTSLAFAPDGRMFVTEKQGRVMVVKNGQKLGTPFLNLVDETLNAGDRGMTSIAFDPNFAQNQYVYVFYSVNPGGGADDNGIRDSFGRVVRYTANGDRADTATRTIIIDDIPACFTSHVNDAIRFAPDGSLIVSTGDAASFQQMDSGGLYDECFGPGNPLPEVEDIGAFRSQQLESLAGKILRINPSNGQGYPSNPFYNGDPDANISKVWSFGLRNPFSITIRPGTGSANVADGRPGSIFIGDVGWRNWEEIDIARTGGENFGWPCYEGPFEQNEYQRANPASNGCDTYTQAETVNPALYWTNQPSNSFPAGLRGDAIIVGDFYQGNRYPPAYQGVLFYADYPNGWMATGRFDSEDRFESQTVFSTNTGSVVGFAYDPTSKLMHYINIGTGQVLRVRHQNEDDFAGEVPEPWVAGDIGTPVEAGETTFDGAAFTLTASGELGPAGNDAFQFVRQPRSGDFTLTARMDDFSGGTQYARGGLMARQGTATDAPYLHLTVTKQDGTYFEWRADDGSYAYRFLDGDAAPKWIRLVRIANRFEAFTSPDGGVWSSLGTIDLSFAQTLDVGLALTGDDVSRAGVTATSTFSEVTLGDGPSDPGGLPNPWQQAQVGTGIGDEEATFNGTAFSVTSSGDIWGDADNFYWAYQPLTGDGSVQARFSRIAAPFDWSKAGLMIRESLAQGSAHAFLVVTPTRGLHLQSRPETSAFMDSQFLTDGEAPVWIRLDRAGTTFTAYTSDDGQTWTPQGSVTVQMGSDAFVGLASAATDVDRVGVVSIGTFEQVAVTGTTQVSGDLPWVETFGQANGTTRDDGDTAWTAALEGGDVSATGRIEVSGGRLLISDPDQTNGGAEGVGVWRSEVIDITGYASVDLSALIDGDGGLDPEDYLVLAYRLDGGPETTWARRTNEFRDSPAETVTLDGLSGETLQLVIRGYNTVTSEFYYVDDVEVTGTTAAEDADTPQARSSEVFHLEGIYPNPFNPATTVRFGIGEAGMYSIEVFNLLGQRVYSDRFREESSTTREVRVDLSGHASGTYVVRVLHEATGYSVREKVVLLR
ncbi:MAG: PQQ-dependent sugar dehydrogenase [Bacteroidota bacterium]